MTAIITITGSVGRDAEKRTTPNGASIISFSVGVDQYEGPGKNKTTAWFSVSAWGDRWAWLLKHAVKGARVCVVGEFRRREYESAKGPGVALEITASSIDVFPRSERRDAPAGERGESQPESNLTDDDIPF